MADTREDRQVALDKLLPLQKEDFKGLLRAMNGKPVQIRLLDPPLHEFMPREVDLVTELFEMEKMNVTEKEIEKKKVILNKVRRIQEANPMIGLRACRVGILYPEIYETQAKAIFEAATELKNQGFPSIIGTGRLGASARTGQFTNARHPTQTTVACLARRGAGFEAGRLL